MYVIIINWETTASLKKKSHSLFHPKTELTPKDFLKKIYVIFLLGINNSICKNNHVITDIIVFGSIAEKIKSFSTASP